MRKANIGLAVFFLIMGLVCLYDSIAKGWRWLPVTGPGAGFLPFYLSVGCIVGSILIILKELKKADTGAPLVPEGGLAPILWVLIPSTVMLMIVPIFGLHAAALIYIAFYMRVVGKIEVWKCAAISILFPVSLYVIFDKVFLIPLPSGLVGDFLFGPVGKLYDVIF